MPAEIPMQLGRFDLPKTRFYDAMLNTVLVVLLYYLASLSLLANTKLYSRERINAFGEVIPSTISTVLLEHLSI